MTPKVFLGIILIFTIFYQLSFSLKEGACNYNDGTKVDDNGNVISRSSSSCQEAGIVTNSANIKETQLKLNELTNIAEKVKKNVYNNIKSIGSNKKNVIRLASAVNDDDSGNGEECEKHPEACEDGKPYPTVSRREYEKAMKN